MVVPNTPTTTAAAAAFGLESGNERVQRHLAPGHVHHEQHGHIGEQRERQPFQEEHVAVVGHENLQKQASRSQTPRS